MKIHNKYVKLFSLGARPSQKELRKIAQKKAEAKGTRIRLLDLNKFGRKELIVGLVGHVRGSKRTLEIEKGFPTILFICQFGEVVSKEMKERFELFLRRTDLHTKINIGFAPFSDVRTISLIKDSNIVVPMVDLTKLKERKLILKNIAKSINTAILGKELTFSDIREALKKKKKTNTENEQFFYVLEVLARKLNIDFKNPRRR